MRDSTVCYDNMKMDVWKIGMNWKQIQKETEERTNGFVKILPKEVRVFIPHSILRIPDNFIHLFTVFCFCVGN